MLKSFTVFNLDQIENIDKPAVTVSEVRTKHSDFTIMANVEETIQKTGAVINHLGVRAFYSPSQDSIT
ncbi:DNA primase, partial [Photobacterium damselae]